VHIPDGYLSPQTCAAGFAVAVPTWVASARKVTKVVKTRNVPMLAVLSAVCFLIMMFNVPIPDGTTAHAVGGTLVAICLGRWAATIAVSVALLFQALLFGDGGVLAYGVNVTNMAIILPFVGLAVYQLVAGKAPLTSTRRVVAAAVGSYVGICTAALAAGIELGIQPDLFKTSNGTPLYAPYHLSQSIPPMLLANLLVAGVVEGILTAGVVAYLQRADLARLVPNHPGIPLTAGDVVPRASRLSPGKVAVGFIAVMVVLTPLGLLAPGEGFGEGAPQDLNLHEYGLHAIPSGLQKYNGFWSHALLNDYGFNNGDHPDIGYVLSAVVGIAVIGLAIFLIGHTVQWWSRRHDSATPDKRYSSPTSTR
jgi:cobalt/nickel transport system permease protein